MFPSLFNIILCTLLIANFFIQDFINQTIFTVIIITILVFNIISFIAAIVRKKLTNQKINILKEILKSLGANSDNLDLNKNLKLIVDEVGKIKQKIIATQNHNEYLNNYLNELALKFKNINIILSYLEDKNIINIKNLIDKTNENTIQDIYSLTKTTISYETNYDNFENINNARYENVKIAVLNDNELENYILELLLQQQGIKVDFFTKADDFSKYACVIADEKYDYHDKNTIVLSNSNNKANYIKRPIGKTRLKSLLAQYLKDFKSEYCSINNDKDMIIFLDNKTQNDYLLHIANKHANFNKVANSLSEFKTEILNHYKIIAIGYQALSYDYEAIVNSINTIKQDYPNTFVMLFLGNKHSKKSLDFADLIIKDASETQIAQAIKQCL